MVTAESLCCGTPVVGFKAGAPEQIAISEYSKFVDYGQLNNLYHAIKSELKDNSKVDVIMASEMYSSETMCCGYINIYNLLYKGSIR